MDMLDPLPPSVLRDRLIALADVYARADAAVDAFVAASGLACPFGCGTCCEAFIPDILPVEADFVALHLVRHDRDDAYRLAARGLSAQSHDGGRLGCPLYRADTPYHCGVYENRPLICRMFAFSAVRDKHGHSAFSLCKLMHVQPQQIRIGVGSELVSIFRAEPPVMADFGSELVGIDPAVAGIRRPIHELIGPAIMKLLFLVGMGSNPEGNGPPVSPPVPRAS